MEAVTSRRGTATTALLDAAERLLIETGYAQLTTRKVAAEAGVNHGLVHYYFGSMEELLLQVLERFTGRLIDRQTAMYEADAPFLEKWRTAMRWLDEDVKSGYPKVWWELQAMAWNHPEMHERLVQVDGVWRQLLRTYFASALEEYGIDFPLEATVALVMTFNKGMQIEQLSGITAGHRDLLDWIDGWLEERAA
ncbi:MAG TPA: helix-turn-helix domain-containing protein [Thermoleophilaceae bacterium]|jgi:AcrR family transcriptional regulator|nr:helix-turn-helix domain-containing protein [Thermoleophilaceae bacterium]